MHSYDLKNLFVACMQESSVIDSESSMILAYNLVTRKEIAERYEIHLRTVHGWTERRQSNNFPFPLRKVSREGGQSGAPVELYWWPVIENWHDHYIPKKGRNHNGTASRPRVTSPMGD